MPSVTLPCHMSLFHSVDPARHGILTNTYVPQVRPIDSLGDTVAKAGKRAAMFYNWEELRDLNRPGNLIHSEYISQYSMDGKVSDRLLTDHAISCIQEENPDFLFLYLGFTDEAGLCLATLAEADGAEYILVTAGAPGQSHTDTAHARDAAAVYQRLSDALDQ